MSKIFSAFPREFRRQFQYILSPQLLPWKSRFCFFARSLARDSPICSRRHLSSKLIPFIPISADEKGCYFRFRILTNHLASFFCQAIRSDCYLLTRLRLRSTDSLTYILFFLQRPAEVDLFSLFLFERSVFGGLLIQTRRGRGSFLFFSSQW